MFDDYIDYRDINEIYKDSYDLELKKCSIGMHTFEIAGFGTSRRMIDGVYSQILDLIKNERYTLLKEDALDSEKIFDKKIDKTHKEKKFSVIIISENKKYRLVDEKIYNILKEERRKAHKKHEE